jgi:outer membrane lipoprotein SlyB
VWSTAVERRALAVHRPSEKAMRKLLTAVSVAALTACATSSPDVVHPYEAQRASYVYDATVLSIRPVTIDGSQSGLGATAGAVAGGVAGSTIGHGGSPEAYVGSVAGAILGGVVGNAMERGATQRNGAEIIVQLRNGERRSVVQALGNETFAPGDAVVLVWTSGRARISHAPMPAGAPAPATGPAATRPPVGMPVPAAYPDAPVEPVYPSGPVPPRT